MSRCCYGEIVWLVVDTLFLLFGNSALLAAQISVQANAPATAAAVTLQQKSLNQRPLVSIPASDTLRLSLQDARALAVRVNPDLLAARLDIGIAHGEERQAGLLIRSNPSADVLTGGVGTEVGLTQEIEIAGQRGARQAAARAGVERAVAGVSDAARRTLGDVDRTFYRLIAANQRTALADEVFGLNQHLVDITRRQLTAGEISALDFNLAVVESGRSRSRALAARRERDAVANELRRLLALPRATSVVPVVDSTLDLVTGSLRPGNESSSVNSFPALASGTTSTPDTIKPLNVDSLVSVAMSRRPDLAQRSAAVRQALAEATVARREAFPNLALRASSERLEGSNSRVLRPGIGLTLPLFNRNQGEVEARRAAARQAELERLALIATVRSEIAGAAAAYDAASAEAEVLETTVLTPARANRRLLEIAYREGKVGLPVLLLIRNQVIDAELEYWDAWLAAREARADLVEATGETVVNYNPASIPNATSPDRR